MRTRPVRRTIASTVLLAGWGGNGLLDAKRGGGISALMRLQVLLEVFVLGEHIFKRLVHYTWEISTTCGYTRKLTSGLQKAFIHGSPPP